MWPWRRRCRASTATGMRCTLLPGHDHGQVRVVHEAWGDQLAADGTAQIRWRVMYL